jgi:integrase
MTVRDGMCTYLEHLRRKGNKPNSLETSKYRLTALLSPAIDVPVKAFNQRRAASLYEARVAGGAAVSTHHSELKQARAMWAWLIESRKMLGDNVWREVAFVGKPSKGKKQHHGSEAARFHAAALDWALDPPSGWRYRFAREAGIAALCALDLGLRASEIVGLQARDVDMGGTELWVAENDGKSEAARRRLLVLEPLAGLLAARAAELEPEDRLFAHGRGWVLDNVRRICRIAGVAEICAHGLRGTHASLATEAGASARAVAVALGHASPQVTADHYTRRESADAARQQAVLRVVKGGRM